MDALVLEHMKQNGGYFEQVGMKDAVTGKMLPGGSIETCSLCHGPGGIADLRDAHGIDEFEVYNVRDND